MEQQPQNRNPQAYEPPVSPDVPCPPQIPYAPCPPQIPYAPCPPQVSYAPYPPQEPCPPVIPTFTPVPPPQAVRHVTRGRDLALFILLAICSVFLVNAILFSNVGLFTSVSMSLIGLSCFIHLWIDRRRTSVYSLFCALASVLCSVTLFMHNLWELKFFTLLASGILLLVSYLDMMQVRHFAAGTIYAIGDFFWLVFAMTFGKLGSSVYALFHRKGEEGSVRGRKVGNVLLGLAIATPLVLIIVPLLIRSDAAFETLLGKFRIDNVAELVVSFALGLFLSILLFGQVFHLPKTDRARIIKTEKHGLDSAVISSFLFVLSAIYAVYLFSQLAYFFNAFRGLLPKDYTVAQYARRGFGEMCALCVINLAVILFGLALCRGKGEKPPVSVRLPALLLCLFSVLFVAISMSKMVLYIQRFGMTQLRILTSGFMLFLAVVFISVAVWLFVKSFPYLKIAVVACALILLVFGFGNVDRTIAQYNVRAYQSGTLKSIDMETLGELSDASVPYLIELLDDSDEAVAQKAQKLLYARVHRYFEPDCDSEGSSWKPKKQELRGFNLDSYRAQELLAQNLERIMQ